uniref:Putative transglycosylase n=1 Tax=viral metagenome TaxID=1070528 RepID=A0A6M3JRC3_9ZZZZ
MGAWDALIQSAAMEAGIDPSILAAVVAIESKGNPRATRYEPAYQRRYVEPNSALMALPWGARRIATSYGLGQMMYPTALEVGLPSTTAPEALFDPALNLRLSARYLAKCLRRSSGNVEDAISRYNSGQPLSKAPAYTRGEHLPRFRAAWARARGQVLSSLVSFTPSTVGLPVTILTGVGLVFMVGILRRILGDERNP